MKTRLTLLALLLLLLLLVVGCGKSEEKIKIGISLPLTGEAASYGQGGLAGIETALKEINEAGGINGKTFELVVEDDKCNAQGGIAVFNKLVNIDQVTAIIGPVCSAAAGPGLPIAQESKTPVILAASAPPLPIGKDYVFRTSYSDTFQGKFGAEYLFNKLEKKKVAVIYVQNDWGLGIKNVFVDTFKNLGGKIVYDEGIAQDAKDLRTVITKAKDSNPEALYFPVYPALGVIGLKQIKELGFNILILGGDSFDTDEFVKSGVANGVMYTIGKIGNPPEFKQLVKEVAGKDSNIVTPWAYDAVKILGKVISKVGTDKRAIRDALSSLSYDKAIMYPKIEFDSEGEVKSPEFEVRIVEDNKAKPLQ